jgi:release factor glutamine methyltransferase
LSREIVKSSIRYIKDLSRYLAAELSAAGVQTPMLDARILTAAAVGLDGDSILAARDQPVSAVQIQAASALCARRAAGEPVSRIIGMREFWSLPFRLSEATLDPRADSETLIEVALKLFENQRPPARIIDLGTGSGCLLLALLSAWPDSFGIGIDLSGDAVKVAAANAAALGLARRAQMQVGNWLDGVPPRDRAEIGLLIANPPYIPAADIETLAVDVRAFDPQAALDGGPDGLDAYRQIAAQLAVVDQQNSHRPVWLIFEIGYDQAAAVSRIFDGIGYHLFQKQSDYGGNDRCLVFQDAQVMGQVSQ